MPCDYNQEDYTTVTMSYKIGNGEQHTAEAKVLSGEVSENTLNHMAAVMLDHMRNDNKTQK